MASEEEREMLLKAGGEEEEEEGAEEETEAEEPLSDPRSLPPPPAHAERVEESVEMVQRESPVVDEAIMGQLLEMGYAEDLVRRAVLGTNGRGVQEAVEWLMVTERGVEDPPVRQEVDPSVPERREEVEEAEESTQEVDAILLQLLKDMGFEEEIVATALTSTGSTSIETIMEWILTMQEREAHSREREEQRDADRQRETSEKRTLQTVSVGKEEVQKQVEGDYHVLHKAVWFRDAVAVKELVNVCPIDRLDAHGNTPLHLAILLSYYDIAHILLERGADTQAVNSEGWDVLQEACATRNAALVTDVYLCRHYSVVDTWKIRLSSLIQALYSIPDFHVEIRWEIGSWIPLVSRFAPSDTFKIWKKGPHIRFDSTLVGFEDFKAIRGHRTFLFDGNEPEISRIFSLIDHERKVVMDAIQTIRTPDANTVTYNVRQLMREEALHSELHTKGVQFQRKKTLFGGDRVDNVHGWNAEVLDMTGLAFSVKTRSPVAPQVSEYEEYFKEGQEIPSVRRRSSTAPHDARQVRAMLWLSQDFPLPVIDLLPVLDVLAPANENIAKIREFFAVKFPDGFPVRIEIPVVPGICATATFTKFAFRHEMEDSLFAIPPSMRRVE